MKKIVIIVITALALTGCSFKNEEENNPKTSNSNVSVSKNKDKSIGTHNVTLYLFYSTTCPHCHAELEWLETIKKDYPYLNIVTYVASDNMDLYEKVVTEMNIDDYHVPLTIIGTDYYIGYSEYKNDDFIKLIEDYSKKEHCDMVSNIIENKNLDICNKKN